MPMGFKKRRPPLQAYTILGQIGDRSMPSISETEATYIRHGFEHGIRHDGRSPMQHRPIRLQTGILQQSNGSARCQIGLTEVLVSIKADVGIPFPEEPNLGSIDCKVAVSPCALKGTAGEIMGEDLGKAIHRSLKWQQLGAGSALDLSALSIVPGKNCWVLQLDGLVISSDGNLLGALSIAAKAALTNLRIPKIDVTMGEEGDDPDLDLDDNPELAASLDTSRVPIIVTITQGGSAKVVDLTEEEEAACPENSVHVAVTAKGVVCGVEKSGSLPIFPGALCDMMEAAQSLAPQMHKAVDRHLQSL